MLQERFFPVRKRKLQQPIPAIVATKCCSCGKLKFESDLVPIRVKDTGEILGQVCKRMEVSGSSRPLPCHAKVFAMHPDSRDHIEIPGSDPSSFRQPNYPKEFKCVDKVRRRVYKRDPLALVVSH